MKIPRDLSGRNLVKLLCQNWGYSELKQEGSHIILQTETPSEALRLQSGTQERHWTSL